MGAVRNAPMMARLGAILLVAVLACSVAPGPVRSAGSAPTALTPAAGSHLDGTPILGWTPAPGAVGYRVELAGPGGYGTPLLARTTVNRWLTLADALDAGPHAWRVAATFGDGSTSAWSEATFTIDEALAAPTLEDAVVDAAWPSTPRLLAWSPVSGAAGYDVRLTSGPLDTLDDTDGFAWTGTRFVVAPAVTGSALVPTMYWQVRARGAGELQRSAWSEVGELRSSWTAAPAPVTPDGATVEAMVLDWDRMAGATSYLVELEPLDGQGSTLSLPVEASRIVVDDVVNDAWYGDFRWRVRGRARATFSGDGFDSAWSAWRAITLEPVDGPVLLAPANGASRPGTPRLSWTPVPRMTDYLVAVSTDPTFETGVDYLSSRDTAIEAGQWASWPGNPEPMDLEDGETYHWRVRASQGQSRETAWSATRSFTVDAPAIDLHGPPDGATVAVPTLTWDSSRALVFRVVIEDANGDPVASERTSAGRWTPRTRLDPADGPFTWWVEARSFEDEDRVLARSGPRTFEVTALTASASEPVIADPPPDEPWFTMTWTPVAGAAGYDIVVSSPYTTEDVPLNRDGRLGYPAFTHPGTWVWPADLFQDPAYEGSWEVIAYDADGIEIARGPGRTIPRDRLDAPALTGPASCTSDACGTPTSPTFTWSPVPNASYYQVVVTDTQGTSTSETTSGTAARMRTPVAQHEGTLPWHVRACTTDGCSPASETRTYRWTRVVPTLVGPADGVTVEDEVTVSITGGTPPSAPPGTEPAWTFQDPKLLLDDETYVADEQPATFPWGYEAWTGGPSRSMTLVAATPSRIAPADGATVDASPLLRWSPRSNVRGYAVEIHAGGTGPLGVNTVVESAMAYDASYAPTTALAPGTYRWRVRRAEVNVFTLQPVDGSPWSPTWTFTVPGATPPTLNAPATGTTRSPADLLFTWSGVPGASAYRVELSRDAGFGVMGYAATSVSAGWAPAAPLSGGTWYWRVVALGLGDTPIAVSSGRAVVIDAPLLKPLRNAVVVDRGQAFATWHDVDVTFPIAEATGARRVRLSNDGVTWRTLAWQPHPFRWDVAPGAVDLGNGQTTADNRSYTVHGQWEDANGTWSAVSTDSVFFDEEDPVATVTLDGGAATTGDPEVLLDVDIVDADGPGAIRVCQDGLPYAYLAGGTAPVPLLLADPSGPPGPRTVCVLPYDVRDNEGEQACATIELTGSGTPATPAGHVGLRYTTPNDLSPSHWQAGDAMTITPVFGAGRTPAGAAMCTWELRWGDHAALRDGALNGTGGGVATTGSAAEGFCGSWTFTLPNVTAGMVTVGFTARAADGSVLAATPTSWGGRPRFRINRNDSASPFVTGSSLPIVTLAVEGSEEPGEDLTYSATAHGFTPVSASLSARSPGGTTVTSANGTSLTVTAPEVGRWAVRWTGLRGSALVAAFLDPTSGMLDTVAPVVTVPVAKARTGQRLGSTLLTRLLWTGSDVGSGVAKYELQLSRDGGSWTSSALTSAMATSKDVSLSMSGSYRWRVRAIDKSGNPGAWVMSPLVRADTIGDSAAKVSSSWRRSYASSYLGGSTRYATARSASASYTFTGNGIAWIAHRGPSRGSATVYVDGERIGTVSLHSSSTLTRRVIFSRAWPVSGTHTIRIVVAGTSGHPRVDIDGFVILR